MKKLLPKDNKFHKGNNTDKKHYWLTPPELLKQLKVEFNFDFDACPYPKPDDFDGLTCEWGRSTYVNPPFGSIVHNGKKKGATAWARKAIEEMKKGKKVVMVYPIDKWILMLLANGAEVRNLGDIKWNAIEDGSAGKGTGRHVACFILYKKNIKVTCQSCGINYITADKIGADYSGDEKPRNCIDCEIEQIIKHTIDDNEGWDTQHIIKSIAKELQNKFSIVSHVKGKL